MAAANTAGRAPRSEGERSMTIDIVLVHIVIALGIMALAARVADSGK
jgi:hypothetical protein